ncbi:MAG: SusC/RagA family TonB-linked outer membrane protein, partial [Pedobacter sp.]
NYNYSKKNHNFTGLLGYTSQQTWIDDSRITGLDFPTETFQTLNQAAQIDQSNTNTLKDQIGLVSYLGRLTYDYKSKYMLTASFRTDGSSYFAPGKKYGFFPAVSAGWNIASEPFMSEVSWLSNMKLRTSYGATGNNRITSFSYQDLLYPSNYGFGAGTGSVNLGLSPNSNVLANPGITWERTFESNTGLDLGFLQNRFNLSAEFYHAITDKLLFNVATMGFSGSNEYINNAGKVSNTGIEFEFSSSNIKSKNFEWNTAINFSRFKNKLLELGGESYQYNYGERNEIYAAIIGAPSIQFLGYRTDGVWMSQAQIDEARAQPDPLTSSLARYFTAGGLKFKDINGDNVIDVNDRVVLGDPFPDFIWGITNNFKFKGFDLNVLLQGSQGGKLINGDANYNESKRFNANYNTDSRWLSEMHPGDGKTPYAFNGVDWMISDYVIEDASYISLRNVILGYTIPQKTIKKLGVNSVRVYAAADNLLYFMGKDYKGINPEARTTSSAYSSPLVSGYQRGAFPLLRTFTLGLDFNF